MLHARNCRTRTRCTVPNCDCLRTSILKRKMREGDEKIRTQIQRLQDLDL